MSLVLNAMIAVMSVVAWQMIFWGAGQRGELAERRWTSLKYFTVLSNLLSGLASLFCVVFYLSAGTPLPTWLLVLKLAAATSVMLTFLTVVILLGPTYGYLAMYRSGNLWMHLILPLLAALDCIVWVPVGTLPFALTLCAPLLVSLYALWYGSTVIAHLNDEVEKYDFYGFARWGTKRIPLVSVCVLGGTWTIALVLWWLSMLLCQA